MQQRSTCSLVLTNPAFLLSPSLSLSLPLSLPSRLLYGSDCDSKDYELMAAYATLMVFVYPIGVSFTLFMWMWSYRHHLDPEDLSVEEAMAARMNDKAHGCSHHIYFTQFVPRYWWYESVNLGRRLT